MKRIKLLHTFFAALFLLVALGASAQQVSISGNVKEASSGEPAINATVSIKGKVAGTITDIDGNFNLKTTTPVPFTIVISGVGVESQEVEITQDGQVVNVSLEEKTFVLPGGDLVVSASRVEEKIMESPVTVEKLDNIAIRQSATNDYYDELSKLKGVHTNQGSLTFTAINTRGFASIANTRFVQLMDGMDNAAPLLNFPTGNIVGISELDIQNVELVPGAASALYGPNAFNGILLMNSKSPFDFQGLSAMVKVGATSSQGDDNPIASVRYPDQYNRSFNATAPMVNAAVRYAKAFNNKFAFKVNFAYLTAQDWPANDYSTDRVWGRRDSAALNARNFDGMNIYGDEVQIALTRDLNDGDPQADTTLFVTRTGWREEDILDRRAATSLKADASFHYRINDDIEAIASYRIGSGNSVYQGSERYALRNFIQQFAKLEFKGSNFFVRAYGSFTDDGDSYNMTALGSYMNEAIMPTAAYDTLFGRVPGGWAVAYNFAYGSPDNPVGAENGLQAFINAALASQGVIGPDGQPLVLDGSDYTARAFADMGGFSLVNNDPTWYPILRSAIKGSIMGSIPGQAAATYDYLVDHLLGYSSGNGRPAVGSPEYNQIMETIRGGLFQRGGAGFIDASRLWHVEGQYDFTHLTKDIIELQVGGNFRRYSLWTDGTIFNEDPLGTGVNSRIGINEFGAFVQVTKRLVDDRIRITASYRYDKNQNFKGRFTPRVATVFTLGKKRQHNIRASFQTGFRNPDTQAQYIYFPTSVTLLGGAPSNNPNDANASYHVYGEPVITETSWNAYRAGLITAAQIDTITVDYIKPEKLTAFELGYKALFANRVFVDVSGYYNIYRDFQSQINVRNTTPATHKGNLVGLDGSGFTTWRAYTNQPDTLYSWGASIGTSIKLFKGFTFSGNYSFADYSVNQESLANGFQPGFNTPKHRFNVGLEQRDQLLKNFGFNISYRWQDTFFWENSFGSGQVPSFGQLDAQVNYTIRSLKTIVKVGCSNIIGPEFVTNTGGPFVGRMPFVSLVYDGGMK